MKLLDDGNLERSAIVANSRMNRERGAVGVNSYEKDVGLDPISFLADRLQTADSTSWLDLCCGRGRALVEAAEAFRIRQLARSVAFHGVDLVDLFDEIPPEVTSVKLESASLHQWETTRAYDLITCVHGLHYVGDKLSLIEHAASWLTVDGLFLANLDLANLRSTDGQLLGRAITKRFRACGLIYNRRRHVISCVGAKSLELGYRYVGADDSAGPNYSGQEAVDSYYEPHC
jgi:SAM-dependent methyltransferase